MSASGLGSLIQATVGSFGGWSRRCRNHAGLAVYAVPVRVRLVRLQEWTKMPIVHQRQEMPTRPPWTSSRTGPPNGRFPPSAGTATARRSLRGKGGGTGTGRPNHWPRTHATPWSDRTSARWGTYRDDTCVRPAFLQTCLPHQGWSVPGCAASHVLRMVAISAAMVASVTPALPLTSWDIV